MTRHVVHSKHGYLPLISCNNSMWKVSMIIRKSLKNLKDTVNGYFPNITLSPIVQAVTVAKWSELAPGKQDVNVMFIK
jgi:hypothetical protein